MSYTNISIHYSLTANYNTKNKYLFSGQVGTESVEVEYSWPSSGVNVWSADPCYWSILCVLMCNMHLLVHYLNVNDKPVSFGFGDLVFICHWHLIIRFYHHHKIVSSSRAYLQATSEEGGKNHQHRQIIFRINNRI